MARAVLQSQNGLKLYSLHAMAYPRAYLNSFSTLASRSDRGPQSDWQEHWSKACTAVLRHHAGHDTNVELPVRDHRETQGLLSRLNTSRRWGSGPIHSLQEEDFWIMVANDQESGFHRFIIHDRTTENGWRYWAVQSQRFSHSWGQYPQPQARHLAPPSSQAQSHAQPTSVDRSESWPLTGAQSRRARGSFTPEAWQGPL